MRLTDEQMDSVHRIAVAALKGQDSALTGYAGTGKTTATLALVDMLEEAGMRPLLTAPTHKAAHVLARKAGRDATTLHATLGLVPVPDYDGGRVLRQMGEVDLPDNGVLVIDESSMLSERILDDVIGMLGIPVILIGDPGQLPPVGEDKALFVDWVRDNGGAVQNLSTIMRQAGDNPLPHVAATLRNGASWPVADSMGREGGVRVLWRKEAEGLFLEHAKAHDGDQDTVRPWISYTNRAASTMAMKARVARLGNVAYMRPYLKGEVCVMASPVIHENRIVVPNSAVVTIMDDPQEHPIQAFGEDWLAWRVTLSTGHALLAMPFEARTALLKLLADAARSDRNPNRNRAWERFYEMEGLLADMRSIYSSTTHKAQGSTYPDVFIDATDMAHGNAAPIFAGLSYTALTRPSSTAYLAR